ncbi:aldehyde dehydrogenase family protein [Pollutibacter soli]|uniref:aldehyde dehydrogenase family protein n=1 Tax=Pollutibacter soli TaxID=3034157 RepID=UPI0030132339
MNIINPATGKIITTILEDDRESLERKLDILRSGAASWRELSIDERILVIRKFHQLLEEDRMVIAKSLTEETGKPLSQAVNEINGARTRITWLCDHSKQYLSDEVMTESKDIIEKISYEPLGVICNISAWNYPWLVGVNVWIPALLAGNGVMYKPSEFATLTGQHVERLLKKAGVPDDVFQLAIGEGHVGRILTDLSFDGYYFTGSYATGQSIYEAVAKKMVPCQLELGGKDPLYVTDDIEDIKAIAAGTADGAFYNNGQSCCAVERIYVHEKVYDKYVDEFVKEVGGFKMGDPQSSGVYIGALTRKAQLRVLEAQVKDAVEKGAILMAGGKTAEREGNYFEPTVLLNVNHDMLVMKEESFGPIIGIMKVKNDDEAIELMNDTEYGLTAAVYSRDEIRAQHILRKLDVGTGYWNCCDRVSAAVPWSGRHHSGFGATLSHQGLRAFTKPKAWQMKR